MSQSYEYEHSDFTTSSGVVNIDRLTLQIGGSSIDDTLESISDIDTTVTITFDAALSGAEETTLDTLVANHDGDPPVYQPEDWEYWREDPIVIDPVTEKEAEFSIMQALVNRRELFNDEDNPVYDADHTPILGSGGWGQDHANKISNLETIHGKLGWHEQEVLSALFERPKDLLIYYGWLNSFNSGTHGWNNENVAKEMAQYELLVFGDGLQTLLAEGTHTGSNNASVLTDSSKSWTTDELVGKKIVNMTDGCSGTITGNTATTITCSGGLSGGTDNDFDTGDSYRVASHGDYVNVLTIVDRIKQLNPCAKIFGYVTINQSLSAFQGKVDDWDTLGVHGIFLDEAGYDYGTTTTNSRDAFNTKVDYVHGKTTSNICFANAWNMDHIIGTANDVSYPNTTWNSDTDASNLLSTDWYLLESHAINTTAYTASTPDGYEAKADWAARGVKAQGHRATYGINLAASGVISNGHGSAQDLFDFLFTSAMMWSFDAVGSSDTSYGSSSAAVTWWTRPDVSKMGKVYSLNAAVQVDAGDADVYWRYVQCGKFSLDFSSSAQDSSITKW